MAATESGGPTADGGTFTRSFRPRAWGQRALTLTTAFASLLILSVLIIVWPTGFVVYSPGPSDVLLLDDSEDTSIHIEGAKVYPTNGTLLWTSLTITARDQSLGLPEAVMAFLRNDWDVFPRELAYPVGRPVEQVAQEAEDSVSPARRNAIVAGLRAAGRPVSQTPIITYVRPAGPSYGRLHVGDLIIGVDNEEVRTASDVASAVAKHAVGDKVNIKIMDAKGIEYDVVVTAEAGNAAENTAKLGVSFADSYRYEPILVTFNTGPHASATGGGLLLSLGLYEMLGKEDLLAGRRVAASGTVDASGTVSSVAGITEKLISAERDGADVFLLPASSCGVTPASIGKMRIVVVSSLTDAIESLRLLRDDPLADVPHC
ncbi:MAG: PDZ domain-containing protein [Propionibacteriaceae bacterium]|jgi:PDZ domain-containing protein|nr:PDZ domain-containing protein [Propionibacteriaceae bacterium]